MGLTSVDLTNRLTRTVVSANLQYQRRGNTPLGREVGIVEKAEHACYSFDEHAEDHAAAWVAAAGHAAALPRLSEARQLLARLTDLDGGYRWSASHVRDRLRVHPIQLGGPPTARFLASAAEKAGEEFRGVVHLTTGWPRVPKKQARRRAEAVLRCKMAAYRYLAAIEASSDPNDADDRRLMALAALVLMG